MTKKWLAALLALVMMLTVFVGCGEEAPASETPSDETAATTPSEDTDDEEEGGETQVVGAVKLTDCGVVEGDPQFMSGGILYEHTDDGIVFYNQNGKNALTVECDGVDSLITNGVCIVEKKVSETESVYGVVDTFNGKVLVPCEANSFSVLSDRFVMVGYKTGEATKDDDFHFYFDANGDTVYYKGYGKVLDLDTGAFVPELKGTNSYFDFSASGNVIFLADGQVKKAYSADGKLLGEYEYMNPKTDSALSLQSDGTGLGVFDADLNKVSLLSGDIYDYKTINGNDSMLIQTIEDAEYNTSYAVIDLEGKQLSAEVYPDGIDDVYAEKYILYRVKQDDGDTLLGIDDMDGNEIVPAKYDAISYYEPGYFDCNLDGKYDVYNTAGEQCGPSGLSFTTGALIFTQNNENDLLILNEGEMRTFEEYPRWQIASLVYTGNELVDVISGETVLTDVDNCIACGEDLYVYNNDTGCFTRYTVEYVK